MPLGTSAIAPFHKGLFAYVKCLTGLQRKERPMSGEYISIPALSAEEIEALEEAYAQWRADYSHVHALAGLGDVFDLLLRLMAAYPKSLSSAVGLAPTDLLKSSKPS